MNPAIEPLVNDGFAGEPVKRSLSYVQSMRENGKRVVGTYCSYVPIEIIRAIDAVPAVLCAFANKTIETAETVLPANLCPLKAPTTLSGPWPTGTSKSRVPA